MPPDEECKLLADPSLECNDEPLCLDGPPIVAVTPTEQRRPKVLRFFVIAQSLAISVLVVAFVHTYDLQTRSCSQLLYSPAQGAIAYETRKFQVADNRSAIIYSRDPSDEVDRAWNDLYNDFGISQISKSEAKRLPDSTVPIPDDPTQYIMALSVFHELHCLNILRKVVHSDYYADPVTGNIGDILREEIPEHVGHCFDMLRQSLMCAADISPIVWYWNEDVMEAIPVMGIAHSCRSWDRIEGWAKAHKIRHAFDRTIHVKEQD